MESIPMISGFILSTDFHRNSEIRRIYYFLPEIFLGK